MGRIMYCPWHIPCDYIFSLMHNPMYVFGGGVGLCILYSPSYEQDQPSAPVLS